MTTTILGLLLLVMAVANLGSSDGNGSITHMPPESSHVHAHALALLLEQQPTALLANSTAMAKVDSNKDSDSCIRICGNVTIDYPFGLSAGCARTPYFQLECKDNSPFLTTANGSFSNYSATKAPELYSVNSIQVLNITPGYMIINSTTIKAGSCYALDFTNGTTYGNASIQLPPDGPFRITGNNVFFASGCYAQGYTSMMSNPVLVNNGTAYLNPDTRASFCGPTACDNEVDYVPEIDSSYAYCNDDNCSSCTSTLSSSLAVYIWGGGTCGFASVLHQPTFTQAQGNVSRDGNLNYGLQLRWTLEVNETDYPDCSTLIKKMSTYACSPNANCTYIRERYTSYAGLENYTSGYFCECTLAGFQGDGYINGTGCEDIDECGIANLCYTEQGAKCKNLDGNYTCSCPGDLKGDGRRDGSGCKKSNTALIAGLSAGGAFLFVILNSMIIWYIYRKRHNDLRSAFFSADFSRREFLLEIQSKEGANICKLFTYEELQKATDNFSPKMELGTGGFGTVFEGTLNDGTKLAIKKANHDVGGGHNDTKQFINEVTVLSQVNHRNLVKLLGCCLETAVPVLVYEFIPNGNLFEHLRRDPIHMLDGRGVVDGPEDKLHPSSRVIPPLNWNNRLKIAIGTAEALTYLHSGTSPPIFHRDVKTTNILLDEKYNVKVADFGLSKFVPVEATHLSTAIHGTPGYLDPEYFDNCQITDKSDVYSFGVVLLELVTAEKPVDLTRQAGDQNLALRCNRLMKHGRLEDIIDPVLGASSDPKMLAVIQGVASVAMKCVERLRDDRPSMREILEELQSLRRPGGKDGSGSGKSVLGKSRSGKQVRFEEEPLLQMQGMLRNSEQFHNRTDLVSPRVDSSSGSSGSLATNGSVQVSVEVLPR